jgi:hypothetical protein
MTPVDPPRIEAGSGGGLVLSVEAPRPLAAAADLLESRFGWTITYEDPLYDASMDAVDVTEEVRRSPPSPGDAARVLVPRPGKIRVEIVPPGDQPLDPKAALDRVLEAHAAAGNAGVFRLEQQGRLLQIIPRGVEDRRSRLVEQTPILDLPITVRPRRGGSRGRSGAAALEEILRALNGDDRAEVSLGVVPVNLLQQHRSRLDARDEEARGVLRRLVLELGRDVSWRLYNDPGTASFVLNLHFVGLSSPVR